MIDDPRDLEVDLDDPELLRVTCEGETVIIPKACCSILFDSVRIDRSVLRELFTEDRRRLLLEELHQLIWDDVVGQGLTDILVGRMGEVLGLLNSPESQRSRPEKPKQPEKHPWKRKH